MRKLLIGAAVLTGGTAAICTAGAMTLFERVIPRQNELRVDINEMADMKKWEEYKKIITPNREWLEKQEFLHKDVRTMILTKDGQKLLQIILKLQFQFIPLRKTLPFGL